MRLYLSLLITIVSFSIFGQSTPGSVSISLTTIEKNVGFHPKHVLAIWIEDDADSFVKTLKLRAEKRKQYLYTWNSASGGNITDAITGATLSSHGTHSVTWDCTNISGEVVADGDYSMFVEYTSEHAQGPLTSVVFTKSADSFSIQPDDVSYFKDMDIVYTPESSTSIAEQTVAFSFRAFPVPAHENLIVSVDLPESKDLILKVYSTDMKLIKILWNGKLSEGQHDVSWNLKSDGIVPGTYFIVLSGANQISSRQIIVN